MKRVARLAVGLMSGTSADGISAALVRFENRRFRIIAYRTQAYSPSFSATLRRGPTLSAREVSHLHVALGEKLAQASLSLLHSVKVAPERVTVIGSHGHTLYHGPKDRIASTFQIGEPAIIAHRTGIAVVANFRTRDIAAGGEGAPLVPYFDKVFFGLGPPRALQNIGGIANVAVVGQNLKTLAFDTGPGNCLIDSIAQKLSQGRLRYDPQGRLARGGRIDHSAIRRLWRFSFFHRPPPKSTGREWFSEKWIAQHLSRKRLRPSKDLLATLTYFTAYSIAESYRAFVPDRLAQVIVSGGGVRNHTLMHHLRELLAPLPVRTIEDYGVPAQAKEPIAFAFLALRAFQGRINHLPETTGARRACVLGSITPGSAPFAFHDT